MLQDDVLLSGSILENVSFFEEGPDRHWAAECLRLSAFDEDLPLLPQGIDSQVGEHGAALSGGQRQRILIARALYKRPRILLMDEATSFLDNRRLMAVNDAVRSLKMTRLICAHRAETIASAGVIDIAAPRAVLKSA